MTEREDPETAAKRDAAIDAWIRAPTDEETRLAALAAFEARMIDPEAIADREAAEAASEKAMEQLGRQSAVAATRSALLRRGSGESTVASHERPRTAEAPAPAAPPPASAAPA